MGTVDPFYCGTQFLDWYGHNCERCWKSSRPEDYPWSQCKMENAISQASIGDGQVDENLAKRMGYDKDQPAVTMWDCPEREEKRKGHPGVKGPRISPDQMALPM